MTYGRDGRRLRLETLLLPVLAHYTQTLYPSVSASFEWAVLRRFHCESHCLWLSFSQGLAADTSRWIRRVEYIACEYIGYAV